MTAGNAGPPDGSSDDGDGGEPPRSVRSASGPNPDESSEQSLVSQFFTARAGPLMVARETLTSVAVVLLVGALLFAVSGVWPPMVAVESGSMEPHMTRGDLVFISQPGRYTPDASFHDTGVVPYETGARIDYRTFGDYGSVVVYDNPSRYGPPVIHRARFWVEKGENWYDKANPEYVNADNCRELLNCPAPHAGFITKGDANSLYDQANGISDPVKPEWITGVAMFRVPYLGWVRLWLTSVSPVSPTATLSTGHVNTFAGDSSVHSLAGGATASAGTTTPEGAPVQTAPLPSPDLAGPVAPAAAATDPAPTATTSEPTPFVSGGTAPSLARS